MRKHIVKYPALEEEMRKHGDSQKDLAALLGVSIATISRKLSGKCRWNIGDVETICEYYKKDYYQLFK